MGKRRKEEERGGREREEKEQGQRGRNREGKEDKKGNVETYALCCQLTSEGQFGEDSRMCLSERKGIVYRLKSVR